MAKTALYNNAKTRTGKAFPIGTTPREAKAKSDNLNELDIAFTQTSIRIKAFYDKITASNNSSPFYLEVKMEELEMWVEACKQYANSGSVFDAFTMPTQEPINNEGKTGW